MKNEIIVNAENANNAEEFTVVIHEPVNHLDEMVAVELIKRYLGKVNLKIMKRNEAEEIAKRGDSSLPRIILVDIGMVHSDVPLHEFLNPVLVKPGKSKPMLEPAEYTNRVLMFDHHQMHPSENRSAASLVMEWLIAQGLIPWRERCKLVPFVLDVAKRDNGNLPKSELPDLGDMVKDIPLEQALQSVGIYIDKLRIQSILWNASYCKPICKIPVFGPSVDLFVSERFSPREKGVYISYNARYDFIGVYCPQSNLDGITLDILNHIYSGKKSWFAKSGQYGKIFEPRMLTGVRRFECGFIERTLEMLIQKWIEIGEEGDIPESLWSAFEKAQD